MVSPMTSFRMGSVCAVCARMCVRVYIPSARHRSCHTYRDTHTHTHTCVSADQTVPVFVFFDVERVRVYAAITCRVCVCVCVLCCVSRCVCVLCMLRPPSPLSMRTTQQRGVNSAHFRSVFPKVLRGIASAVGEFFHVDF